MSVYSPGPTADDSMTALDGHVIQVNGAPCRIEMLAILLLVLRDPATDYSCRSAMTGLTAAARRAGR
jgi:hypothetical protein